MFNNLHAEFLKLQPLVLTSQYKGSAPVSGVAGIQTWPLRLFTVLSLPSSLLLKVVRSILGPSCCGRLVPTHFCSTLLRFCSPNPQIFLLVRVLSPAEPLTVNPCLEQHPG